MKIHHNFSIIAVSAICATTPLNAIGQSVCQTPDELRISIIINPNGESIMYIGEEKIGNISNASGLLKKLKNKNILEGMPINISEITEKPEKPDPPPPTPSPTPCYGPACPGGINFFTKDQGLIIYLNSKNEKFLENFYGKNIPKEMFKKRVAP